MGPKSLRSFLTNSVSAASAGSDGTNWTDAGLPDPSPRRTDRSCAAPRRRCNAPRRLSRPDDPQTEPTAAARHDQRYAWRASCRRRRIDGGNRNGSWRNLGEGQGGVTDLKDLALDLHGRAAGAARFRLSLRDDVGGDERAGHRFFLGHLSRCARVPVDCRLDFRIDLQSSDVDDSLRQEIGGRRGAPPCRRYRRSVIPSDRGFIVADRADRGPRGTGRSEPSTTWICTSPGAPIMLAGNLEAIGDFESHAGFRRGERMADAGPDERAESVEDPWSAISPDTANVAWCDRARSGSSAHDASATGSPTRASPRGRQAARDSLRSTLRDRKAPAIRGQGGP